MRSTIFCGKTRRCGLPMAQVAHMLSAEPRDMRKHLVSPGTKYSRRQDTHKTFYNDDRTVAEMEAGLRYEPSD